MARPKKEKVEIMDVYETEIEFDCPSRGKIKQKVKVQRYKEKEQPIETIDTTKILGGDEEND